MCGDRTKLVPAMCGDRTKLVPAKFENNVRIISSVETAFLMA